MLLRKRIRFASTEVRITEHQSLSAITIASFAYFDLLKAADNYRRFWGSAKPSWEHGWIPIAWFWPAACRMTSIEDLAERDRLGFRSRTSGMRSTARVSLLLGRQSVAFGFTRNNETLEYDGLVMAIILESRSCESCIEAKQVGNSC